MRIDWLSTLSRISKGLGCAKDALDDWIIEARQHRNAQALRAMHEGVLSTSPLRCNPAGGVEIHTLTAHHHLRMYLTAIKSLLRYYSDLAVVVHDDGTLERDDLEQLRYHIKGVKIILRSDADVRIQRMLATYPHSRRLRQRVVNSLELFDNILLAETARVVNMNSDVLFLSEPIELIAWMSREDSANVGVYEECPAGQLEFVRERACPVAPHVTTALTCFHKEVYEQAFVEEVLSKVTPDWFTAQNIYPLLYYNHQAEHPTHFFDRYRYQASGIFSGKAVFRHYWTSTGLFTRLQSHDSSQVIRGLSAG